MHARTQVWPTKHCGLIYRMGEKRNNSVMQIVSGECSLVTPNPPFNELGSAYNYIVTSANAPSSRYTSLVLRGYLCVRYPFHYGIQQQVFSRTEHFAGSIFISAEWVITCATYFFRAQPEYNGRLMNFKGFSKNSRN